ncbi:MAG: YdcF family protein [Succinivibrionaceae bacterium]|nr:YdcF family protein [Succinivibrionaceae bacterium]
MEKLDPNEQVRLFHQELGGFFRLCSRVLQVIALLFALFMVLGYLKIASYAFYCHDSPYDVPRHRVGLLLGTSWRTVTGQDNAYFTNRIQAAAELLRERRIEYILVSGDNRENSYNEPRSMMQALIREGVPRDRIVADFAGFSTLDSVMRAAQVFMLGDMTIISQDFQNERALFIADRLGIRADAYNAYNPDSKLSLNSLGIRVREFGARIKCIFDMYLLHSTPTFLGDAIAIGDAPLPKQATNRPKPLTSRLKIPGYSRHGIDMLSIEASKVFARQPSDSAIIIRQEEMARVRAQEVLSKQEKE